MRIANLRFVLILLATLLSLSFAGGLDSAPTPGPIVLKYGRIFPEKHWIAKRVEIPWFNLIEKRTKGRVKIEYWREVKRKEQLDALRAKVVDMGMIMPMYFSKELSLTQASGLPLIVDLHKYLNVTKAIFETNEIKKEWEVNNYCKPLLMIPTPSYHFWSKKPIRRLEDLYRIKIGVPPAVREKALDALGASSVPGTPPEIYAALQRGTLDAVYSSTLGFKNMKFYELVKYGALFGAKRNTPFWCSINLDAWKKLPEDIQKIILDTTPEMEENFARFSIKAEFEHIEFLKQKEVEIYTLPTNEVRRLIDTATKQIVDDWIKKHGDPGRKLLQQVEMKAGWPCFLNPPACPKE